MAVIPVIHNVSSVQRVVDMARLVYSLGLGTLVVTKAYGGAAQSGVPEAYRLALREGGRLIVLPDLEDAIELLSPDRVVLVSHEHAREMLPPERIASGRGRVLLVFSGAEPDFSAREAGLGDPVYLEGAPGRLGALAEAAIILYALRRSGEGEGDGGAE